MKMELELLGDGLEKDGKGNGEDRFPPSALCSLLPPWHTSGLSPVASPGGLASALVVLGGSVGGCAWCWGSPRALNGSSGAGELCEVQGRK